MLDIQAVPTDPEWLPDHHLLTAILLRTIYDLQMNVDYSDYNVRRDIKEAICWVKSKSFEDFSFLWLCQQLEIGKVIKEEIKNLAERAADRILYDVKNCED